MVLSICYSNFNYDLKILFNLAIISSNQYEKVILSTKLNLALAVEIEDWSKICHDYVQQGNQI